MFVCGFLSSILHNLWFLHNFFCINYGFYINCRKYFLRKCRYKWRRTASAFLLKRSCIICVHERVFFQKAFLVNLTCGRLLHSTSTFSLALNIIYFYFCQISIFYWTFKFCFLCKIIIFFTSDNVYRFICIYGLP